MGPRLALLWRIGRELAIGLVVMVIFLALISGGSVPQFLSESVDFIARFWAE